MKKNVGLDNAGLKMKIMIMVGKGVTLIFWGAVILSLFSIFPELVATMLGWAGVVILLVHFFEVAMFTRRFGDKLIEPKFDKLMVLVFGIFHVLPFIVKEMEGNKEKLVSR